MNYKNNPKKSLFVAFEGIDGAGKTTTLALLQKLLAQKFNKDNYLVTREPGGSNLGDYIRKYILKYGSKELTAATLALLFASIRSEHVDKKIKPALKQNKLVITDRYWFSSLVYQGQESGLKPRDIININKIAIHGLEPDLIFYFYIDKPTFLTRLALRKKAKQADSLDDGFSYETIYDSYENLVNKIEIKNKPKIIRINGQAELLENVKKILDIILDYYQPIDHAISKLD